MSLRTDLTRKLTAAATVLLVLAGSCRDWPPPPTEPPPTTTLAVCPTDQSQSTTANIGLLGGSLSLGGTSVLLPLGAVLTPITVELTVPASQYMEIGVTADGGSFLFQRAITVTIDYSRCSSEIQQKTLSVWHIDESSKALLENMGGIDNKLLKSITFTTTHLSGYALAF